MRKAFEATRELRAKRRVERGLPPGAAVRGLGKLLVAAPDQATARVYLDTLRGWMPAEQARRDIRLVTSSERDAHEPLAAFRLLPEPSILVTVAMAYEGLDAPEVAVVAALTHIRSRPWLEQMIAGRREADCREETGGQAGAASARPSGSRNRHVAGLVRGRAVPDITGVVRTSDDQTSRRVHPRADPNRAVPPKD